MPDNQHAYVEWDKRHGLSDTFSINREGLANSPILFDFAITNVRVLELARLVSCFAQKKSSPFDEDSCRHFSDSD